MIIAFGSTQLRDICEVPDAANSYMGVGLADVFRDRLADIRAAATLEDLLVGNPRVSGDTGRELRIAIGPSAELVLTANHLHLPLSEDGQVDWSKVSYVKFIGVELF